MRLRIVRLTVAVPLVTGLVLAVQADEVRADQPPAPVPEALIEACSNGIAVPDPEDNASLVQDCAILLSARDTLAGAASLNWSSEIPMSDWEGLIFDDVSRQLTGLLFSGFGLTGEVPAELGSLSSLVNLWLDVNQLTGEIPPELAALSTLENLRLDENLLTGGIPPELSRLSRVHLMELAGNRLTGVIPPEFASLNRLELLFLDRNELSGEVPAWLAGLPRLRQLALAENDFEGCVPRLPHLLVSDLGFLGLPDCAPPPVRIEVRVWQSASDARLLHFSARFTGGSQDLLVAAPITMDGLSLSRLYRYGDFTLAPLAGQVGLEVRVWQSISDLRSLYVSARPAGGSWEPFGTVRLDMQEPAGAELRRYGDFAVEIALTVTRVPVP